MTRPSSFKSGRIEGGPAYVADRSGSSHTRIVRLSAFVLAPLGVLALWFIVGTIGDSYEAVRAEIGRPFVALVLIAFIGAALFHARLGADNIIEDYIQDEHLKTKALAANLWLVRFIGLLWTLSILAIAVSG